MTQDLLQTAIAHHQAGRLDQAEAGYREVLEREPGESDASHLLGVLFHQRGDHEEAIALITKAIAANPDDPAYHGNLGTVYTAAGRLEDAIDSYRAATRLDPQSADAHYNLGAALLRGGRADEAIVAGERAVALRPNHRDSHYNLGLACRRAGRIDKAITHLHHAATLDPGYLDARLNLGHAHLDAGAGEAALAAFRAAEALAPDDARVLAGLGAAFSSLGEPTTAREALGRAIVIDPKLPDAHNALGVVFMDLGDLPAARSAYERAIALAPGFAAAHSNLGSALTHLGQLDAALARLAEAIRLNPTSSRTHNNLGVCHKERTDYDAALESFGRAITLDPAVAEFHNNLGTTHLEAGHVREAIQHFRDALEVDDGHSDAHSNLLYAMNLDASTTQDAILAASKEYGRRHGRETRPMRLALDAGERIRVGYVSPDFRTHSVAYFAKPLIRRHDRARFEVYCYANVAVPDAVTLEVREAADHWRNICGLTDDAVRAQIRADGIHILVDLAGHTAGNRLPLFGSRAAPIQITWLGYPNTTGLAQVDYRLTDTISDPSADESYTEELIRLDGGFLCYEPIEPAPDVGPPPSIESQRVTFGSFNNVAKVNEGVIDVWAEILSRLPSARVLLKAKPLADAGVRRHLLALFAARGIDAGRVDLAQVLRDKRDHLDFYGRIDIGLDPFPYNGTTTTVEALWMGVPVITLTGDRHAGRVGASILRTVGAPELICRDRSEYIERAAELAATPERLRELRTSLRSRVADSTLRDAPGFAHRVEAVYERLVRDRESAGPDIP